MKASPHRDRVSAELRLCAILEAEWARRRRVNPRYSQRALARSVKVEHSTLSQLLRRKRVLTWNSIQHIAATMRWLGSAILQFQARHKGKFDSRAVAQALCVTVDDINVALADLCMFGLMELKGE